MRTNTNNTQKASAASKSATRKESSKTKGVTYTPLPEGGAELVFSGELARRIRREMSLSGMTSDEIIDAALRSHFDRLDRNA